jgi:ribonuclease P/MRP protein subunit POP5
VKIVVYLSPATSTAIIRVARDHYRLVWATLAFVTRLPKPLDTPCVIQVVRNSGTIRKAEEEAIRRAKASVMRAKQAALGGNSVGVDLFKEHGLGDHKEKGMGVGRGDTDTDMNESEDENESEEDD